MIPVPQALDTPRELYVEVTNRCNSLCTTCIRTYQTREPEKDLDFASFCSLIDSLPDLRKVWLHGIGEPTLNRELPKMIRYLKERDIYVLFNSNVVALPARLREELVASGLDELRISLDGATPETYEALRGIDVFDKVVRHAGELVATRQAMASPTPRLSFWLTGIKENVHELPRVVRLAAQTGVEEVHLQRMTYFGEGLAVEEQALYQREQATLQTVAAEAEALAAELGVIFSASGAIPGSEPEVAQQYPWQGCTRPLRLAYVSANGNVLPCCIAPWAVDNDHYEDIVLGELSKASLPEIWHGERYQAFRKALYSPEPSDACRNCGVGWSL